VGQKRGERMGEERKIGKELVVCPVCGEKCSYIEERTVGGNTYYYAVHVIGRGKDRKKIKHYLGPKKYIYVSRTHEREALEFEGRISQERIAQYLLTIISQLERAKEDPTILNDLGLDLEMLGKLAGKLLRLVNTLKRKRR
jgi:hypothetical protein